MEMNNLYSIKVNADSFPATLKDLGSKGYNLKFRKEPAHLTCIELYRWIYPGHFDVDASFYFERTPAPDTDRMIYAISTHDGSKGILVDTCGVYADNMRREMIRKLDFRNGSEEMIR